MSADQDTVDTAATEHGVKLTGLKNLCCESDFKAGVAWARANPSPEVLALKDERNAYAKAMAIALQSAVFLDREKVNREIGNLLAAFKAKERP